jgi:hypothetical protein
MPRRYPIAVTQPIKKMNLRASCIAVLSLLCIVTAACNSNPGDSASSPVLPLKSMSDPDELRRYIQIIDTIEIDPRIHAGMIRSLDADQHGRMLVTDVTTGQVYLLDHQGRHLRTLDAEPCDPGFTMRPVSAHFINDDIWLVNSGPWGYRFDAEGKCTGPMDPSFSTPNFLSSARNGRVFGLFSHPELHIREMDESGRELKRIPFAPSFPNLQMFRGGGMTIAGDFVYVAKNYSPRISRFNLNGHFEGDIGHIPTYFRRVTRDISQGGPAGSGEMRQVVSTHSFTGGVWHLTENRLVVFHLNNWGAPANSAKKNGLSVLDLDGRPVLDHDLEVEGVFLHASSSRLYRLVQLAVGDDGRVPNFGIQVWKYVGP